MTQQSVVETPSLVQDLRDNAFQQAVVQAAAIMERPEYNGRLQKAIDLVLSGNVTLHEDGTATVKSGSHTYHLESDCTCEDGQRRSLYCKHFLAVQLLKRTYERLYQPVNGAGNGQADTPQSAAWQCAQAPSSCTVKWTVGGIELMLTLRDANDDALFGRIKRVLPRIEEKMENQRQVRQETPQEDWCSIHQCEMKRGKDGKAIWCRGK